MAPVLLAGAVLLGAAAGAAYFVPIPGITYASSVSDQQPTQEPAKASSPLDAQLEREAALARMETELKSREDDLKEKESQVAGLIKDLTAQKGEADAVRKAAALYTAMPPYRAAPLLETADTAMAVQVLRLLEEDQAAAILAYMSAERGAQLMNEMIKPPAPLANNP